MTAWHDLEQEAQGVCDSTSRELPDICALLQTSVSLVADGFLASSPVPNGNAISIRCSLLSQNLGCLKCSVDLALRGYYTQSVNLVRTVHENWIALYYLTAFPDKADLWSRVRRHRPPMHNPMLDQLGPKFPYDRATVDRWYHTLCRFAHTDAVGVVPQFGVADGESCIFFGAKLKPELFRTSAYCIAHYTGLLLAELTNHIAQDNSWTAQWLEVDVELNQFLQEENAALAAETSQRDSGGARVRPRKQKVAASVYRDSPMMF